MVDPENQLDKKGIQNSQGIFSTVNPKVYSIYLRIYGREYTLNILDIFLMGSLGSSEEEP